MHDKICSSCEFTIIVTRWVHSNRRNRIKIKTKPNNYCRFLSLSLRGKKKKTTKPVWFNSVWAKHTVRFDSCIKKFQILQLGSIWGPNRTRPWIPLIVAIESVTYKLFYIPRVSFNYNPRSTLICKLPIFPTMPWVKDETASQKRPGLNKQNQKTNRLCLWFGQSVLQCAQPTGQSVTMKTTFLTNFPMLLAKYLFFHLLVSLFLFFFHLVFR